jgi:hypothetical protein
MRGRFLRSGVAVVAMAVALVPSGATAQANHRVTLDNDGTSSYTRYDGLSDATMLNCSHNKRSQNEPAVAVDPRNTDIVTAGSNDYCAAVVNGDVWAGYYRSTDGGATWADSLVPGYPDDSSPAGLASPAHGKCAAAGDPTQSFDLEGRLFYGFICFNRGKPVNGSTYVATYEHDGRDYVQTALVAQGSPAGQFSSGLFQDKINLVVDQTTGPRSGYVYVAWARYSGRAANNVILFSRSTDHGATFSPPVRVSSGLGEEQFADLAVGPNGNVYLTYRNIAHQKSTRDTISIQRSTDGGLSWSRPQQLAEIVPFDSNQFSGNGSADCGDGALACPSGLTFSRFADFSAVTADSSGVHVVWNAELASGQAKIFVRNSPDGINWPSAAATIDTIPVGHQYLPDVASADGVITVVFYDSRRDLAYSPNLPPGNTAAGTNSGDVVDTYVAKSTDGGSSWTETRISEFGSNFNWETHGARMIGFWGDYIYISAVPSRPGMPGAVNISWTDSRDLVPGNDPRETPETDDHDGFDVLQTKDPTLNETNSQGGLDQNIYAARV